MKKFLIPRFQKAGKVYSLNDLKSTNNISNIEKTTWTLAAKEEKKKIYSKKNKFLVNSSLKEYQVVNTPSSYRSDAHNDSSSQSSSTDEDYVAEPEKQIGDYYKDAKNVVVDFMNLPSYMYDPEPGNSAIDGGKRYYTGMTSGQHLGTWATVAASPLMLSNIPETMAGYTVATKVGEPVFSYLGEQIAKAAGGNKNTLKMASDIGGFAGSAIGWGLGAKAYHGLMHPTSGRLYSTGFSVEDVEPAAEVTEATIEELGTALFKTAKPEYLSNIDLLNKKLTFARQHTKESGLTPDELRSINRYLSGAHDGTTYDAYKAAMVKLKQVNPDMQVAKTTSATKVLTEEDRIKAMSDDEILNKYLKEHPEETDHFPDLTHGVPVDEYNSIMYRLLESLPVGSVVATGKIFSGESTPGLLVRAIHDRDRFRTVISNDFTETNAAAAKFSPERNLRKMKLYFKELGASNADVEAISYNPETNTYRIPKTYFIKLHKKGKKLLRRCK